MLSDRVKGYKQSSKFSIKFLIKSLSILEYLGHDTKFLRLRISVLRGEGEKVRSKKFYKYYSGFSLLSYDIFFLNKHLQILLTN